MKRPPNHVPQIRTPDDILSTIAVTHFVRAGFDRERVHAATDDSLDAIAELGLGERPS